MNQNRDREARGTWQRQWVVDLLQRTGYAEAADEAARTLPESIDYVQLVNFCQANGLSRDEVMSRMGGSP
jgi:hypothetical protein